MSSNKGVTDPGHQSLEEIITQLAASTLGKHSNSNQPDTPLLNGQTGFDSFALMEFVLHLEDTFGISIPDEDLDPDIFRSIQTISSYVRTRLEQRD